jgi:ankyrin repeat protein
MKERDFLLLLIKLNYQERAINLINSGKITDKHLNTVGDYKDMVLHLAIKIHLFDLVKFLLTETNINPSLLSSDSTNVSPLMVAVAVNDLEIIKLLISNKADPNLTNKFELKALDYAAHNKSMLSKLFLPHILISEANSTNQDDDDDESLDDTVEMSGEDS